MAKLITKEQMAEQESYIMKLKEENMRYAAQNGHAKLALTETYGCQQNENDTERIRGMLRQAGFDFTAGSNSQFDSPYRFSASIEVPASCFPCSDRCTECSGFRRRRSVPCPRWDNRSTDHAFHWGTAPVRSPCIRRSLRPR